jgi:NADP-dependent 3-hydroxy acid dehydrogenase YdfG
VSVHALGVLIRNQETAEVMIAQETCGKIVNTASIAGRDSDYMTGQVIMIDGGMVRI